MSRAFAFVSLLAVLLLPFAARAQGADVEGAKEHFQRGLALSEQRSWDAALAEFLKSRQLYPRASSTVNAANCLRELHRYDEALDLYEEVTTRFADVDGPTRALASSRAAELRIYVGQIAFTGAEGAQVIVDGRERDASRGVIRVSAGTHAVRASKAGSSPFETRVEVAGQERVTVAVTFLPLGQTTIVKVVHDGDPDADTYHPLAFELIGGLALAPSLGGDAAKTGSAALGLGPLVQVHVAFQTRFGLTVGLTGGYLLVASKIDGEGAKLLPVGESARTVKVDDARTLRGALLGATAGWRFGDVWPITARVGGGVLIGSLSDTRTPTSTALGVPTQATSPSVVSAFVQPEARVGYRFAGHFEVSAGVEALVLFGSAPIWDPAKVGQVNVPRLGLAAYEKETLAGSSILAIAPTLGVRYDL